MLQRKVATHEFTHSQFRGDQRQARRAGIASFIGTTIEWYDFYIYGTAAALVFGDIFFSDTLPNGVGTLLAFITLWQASSPGRSAGSSSVTSATGSDARTLSSSP